MYEIGAETGRYYSSNVPLREGITEDGKFEFFVLKQEQQKTTFFSRLL